ncbi:glycosyltransferase [Curvibacter sp. APW13]|uniref:glycosyltransferase family protein n=1 Tax=Curvibacter sp. APW13 TaxID=3077236 RepID=UPI0028DDCF09|nr:glycosyltransferase [Curvibacter sp. APW13]MDT8991564.1 glycosyltransferase [Curvibacter sp. APW13]
MPKSIQQRWAKRKEKFQRSWEKLVFNLSLRKETVSGHSQVLSRAEAALARRCEHETDEVCLSSPDPVVRQGWALKRQVEIEFFERYAQSTPERVLIQVPPPAYSPAGYSLFTNLAESLEFIGIPTHVLAWDSETREVLEEFQPTVLLSSDHESYLQRIDWDSINSYKRDAKLRVGLTASLQEYENTPLAQRLDWARRHGVDFYYSFRDKDYVTNRLEYQAFFKGGYKILYLPFGANILHYYPVAGFDRDLDYAIMATRKSEHARFMSGIASKFRGFIDGPGWRHTKAFSFNRDRDRYIYAFTKVGLNVHLPEQLQWACEVNERTYQLAACGVPQLMDHPLLIDRLFSKDAVYVADSPAQYLQIFQRIMQNPELAVLRALKAQKEAFDRHTTFHRAHDFVQQLAQI